MEYKNVNTDYSKQLLREKVNSITLNYTMLNNYGEYKKHLNLLNVTPVSYPTLVNMNADLIEKHMLLGCRFKSSMLMYNIQQYHCCGMARPHHIDTEFPNDAFFYRFFLNG